MRPRDIPDGESHHILLLYFFHVIVNKRQFTDLVVKLLETHLPNGQRTATGHVLAFGTENGAISSVGDEGKEPSLRLDNDVGEFYLSERGGCQFKGGIS